MGLEKAVGIIEVWIFAGGMGVTFFTEVILDGGSNTSEGIKP